MFSVEGDGVDRLECSPATPWGVHESVMENVCPRCGWIARETLAERAQPNEAAAA